MARKHMTGSRRTPKQLLILVALVLIVALARQYLVSDPAPAGNPSPGAPTIEAAAADRVSGVMINAAGRVSRVLSDDNEGSRHQRFIVELPSGHTVLVSHNIDLAPRVPLKAGDQVSLHGQYEWNDRGGVMHWTHHDPAGRHEEGWIEHQGQRYE